MKKLVVYDSKFGNTSKIAHVVAHTIEARILPVSKVKMDELDSVGVLVVGSPSEKGKPTLALQKFLESIPPKKLEKSRVAAFDTRFGSSSSALKLKLALKTVGFAAPSIASELKAKGGYLACLPEGFIVKGKEGPLKKGEIERASVWAKEVVAVYETA